MRRIALSGAGLLLCGMIFARDKPEPLTFLFLRVDRDRSLAYLRPVVAPDVGVQLASGSAQLVRGAVVRCETSTRNQSAVVDGQVAKVSELILDCGEQEFIVKGLDFTHRDP